MNLRQHKDSIRLAAKRTAAVAVAYCCLVLALLAANAIHNRAYDPLDAPRFNALLIELNRTPSDTALKSRVRLLDQKLRSDYRRSRAFALDGFYLLLGGIVLFLLANEVERSLELQVPLPDSNVARRAGASAPLSRGAVLTMGIAFGGLLLTLAVLSRHDAAADYAREASIPVTQPLAPPGCGALRPGAQATSQGTTATTGSINLQPVAISAKPTGSLLGSGTMNQVAAAAPIQALPTLAPKVRAGFKAAVAQPFCPKAWQEEWPAFRGPGGGAISAGAPDFSKAKLLWKSNIDLRGWNSPVVWGGRIFVSGADKQTRAVYCFSALDGHLTWKHEVPSGSPPPQVQEDTGYAPSTMATDGIHVAAIFVNGDIACFDFSGKLLWTRHMGMPENTYGHASSLAVYGSGLIVQFDQGSDPTEGKSALFALDFSTGKTVWKVQRLVQASWSTPVLAQVGQRVELITCANPWVISYDPSSGTEIWRASCLTGDVAPSAAVGSGMVFTANQGATLSAIKFGGAGDVSKSAIAWTYTEDLPDISSPLATGKYLYMATSEGAFTCLDIHTGKKLWLQQYEAGLKASPILDGKSICLIDHAGALHFIAPGPTFHEIGKLELGEEAGATPAISAQRLFVRGKDHLYCLGARP